LTSTPASPRVPFAGWHLLTRALARESTSKTIYSVFHRSVQYDSPNFATLRNNFFPASLKLNNFRPRIYIISATGAPYDSQGQRPWKQACKSSSRIAAK
jgi:hypothetical protein